MSDHFPITDAHGRQIAFSFDAVACVLEKKNFPSFCAAGRSGESPPTDISPHCSKLEEQTNQIKP